MTEKMIADYLEKFNYADGLVLDDLWGEMDRVWNSLGLDNLSDIGHQKQIGEFYGHPVWILNGLFSARDIESMKHRVSIGSYIKGLPRAVNFRVADVGGGSGVLARTILEEVGEGTTVDIIEPYPFEYFLESNRENRSIHFLKSGEQQAYDVVVMQDVLEHVDDPVLATFEALSLLKKGGYAIFASCFYPVILCHLPKTFYLRHAFKYVLRVNGLKFLGSIPGVSHAFIFQKIADVKLEDLRKRELFAKPIGCILNWIQGLKNKL